ncbi:methyltransferase family protein [Ornatilinea apprima]|nr:isoprenylcysteine carboxylmethyltransferase family protein [Ornatilinea apprima]
MENIKKSMTPGVLLQVLIFVFIIPLLPILMTRRWSWWEAWVYAAINILGFVASRAIAGRKHPDLLAERARMLHHDDPEPWDRWLAPLVGLGGGLIPLTAGLDGLFSTLPNFSILVKIAALVLMLAGFALGSYALVENRFFSGMVRIQTDRGHKVISSGPYAWIRHPGYTGALVSYIAAPVLLDAVWAFIPAILLSIVLVIRTHLEDETLQDRLVGYREYAEQVRFRLFPGIW